MATRTRTTLAEGIYLDAHGVTVIARIGSRPNIQQATERFGLVDDDDIPYSKSNCDELIKCRYQLLEDLRVKRKRAGGEAGSLGAAIDKWKAEFPLTPPGPDGHRVEDKRSDDHILITHWRKSPLASEQVETLKRSQVRAQLQVWTDAGRGPTTVNHRKRMLADLLRWSLGADDDEDITIVTDGIANLPPRPAEARGIPMPIVARILSMMSDRGRATKGETRPAHSETKIRMRVMAWTGLARKSLIRLDRRRINWSEGKLYFPARKKGKGAPAVWVDLLPPALEALRDYDRAGLWGKKFSRSSMRKSWMRAVANCQKALELDAAQSGDRTMLDHFLVSVPANSKPYDTRHSFATDAFQQSGNLEGVSALLQHADLKTTQRYTKAAVPAAIASVIDAQRAKWFPETPKPGATVRDFHVVSK